MAVIRSHDYAPAVLDAGTLTGLPPNVETPAYSRSMLSPSIIHIGVGGFHRAHQAVYLDDLAAMGSSWGEVGVGILPQDHAMAEALGAQAGLHSLLVRSPKEDTARIIGSLLEYLFAPEQTQEVLGVLAAPSTRLVTLTITEGGYSIDESTGVFKGSDEKIQADLEAPDQPTTVFGYLVEALARRRRAGDKPFSILSCDNIQNNGQVAQTAVTSFARMRDDGLAEWIERHVAFPCSMVDRITPQTTEAEREIVRNEFGILDRWPVVTEPFTQWVVQDVFSDGRPRLEDVGVQLVTDVHPYESMKLRLLNASHSSMGYLGYVAGYRTVDEIMNDSLFRTFIERQMRDEVAPLLAPVPGMDLNEYQDVLIERFSNPNIRDQVSRVCLEGSSKVPKFLLPALQEAILARSPHRWLTVGLAGWLRYLGGADDHGAEIVLEDARANELRALAIAGHDDPRPILTVRDLFGDLASNHAFVADLHSVLHDLYVDGARNTLARYLADG